MHRILFILLLMFIGCSGGDDETTAPCSGTVDCLGACDGSAVEDDCGVCNGNNESMDCNDVCDGTDVDDCIGVCGGTNTISNLSDGCDLPESVTTAYFALKADGTVYFRSPQDIGGFEFILDDVSDDMNISMSGGLSGAEGAFDNLNCVHNVNGAFCMGFAFMGTAVTADCGVLINVSAGICSGADHDADGTADSSQPSDEASCIVVGGVCVGADSNADGTVDTTQPTDEASCLDPAGDDTGTAGTWTSGTAGAWASHSSFTTLSQIIVANPTSNPIVTETYCSE